MRRLDGVNEVDALDNVCEMSEAAKFAPAFSAHWLSLNIMCSMPSQLRQRFVRWRMVAKALSLGFDVRML